MTKQVVIKEQAYFNKKGVPVQYRQEMSDGSVEWEYASGGRGRVPLHQQEPIKEWFIVSPSEKRVIRSLGNCTRDYAMIELAVENGMHNTNYKIRYKEALEREGYR